MARKRPRPRPLPGREISTAGAGRKRHNARWLGVFSVAILAAVVAFWWHRAALAQPNVMLITIDTLRADHVGAYGDKDAATPTLDALAARGARFEQVQTAVPLTGPSHATILTGHYPPVHGVRDNVVFTLGTDHATLATLLQARGYKTAAFVGAYPVAQAFGFSQGFETFDEGFHEDPAAGRSAERPGNEVADAAIKWLSTLDNRPFFMWAHFYDPHAPYAPPPPYKERFREHPYDGEVAFADAQIGRLLGALAASGRDSNTVIVAVGDHGEALGEHSESTHAVLVYQSTMRVPLVVAGPGVRAGQVIAQRIGTVDILPTVLGLTHVKAPEGLPGTDLTRALNGEPLATEPLYGESLFGRLNCRWATLRSWVKGDWKLIDGAVPELYDLTNDPGERQNLADTQTERVRTMRGELRNTLQRMAPAGDRARANPISPDQEERLRSLGYVAGSGGIGPTDEPGLPDPRTHVQLYDRLQAANVADTRSIGTAIEEVKAISGLDPGNPFAYGTLASLAYRGGSLQLASNAFAMTLELDPDRPGVRQNYGKLLRELGRFDQSERELRIALAQTTDEDLRTRVSLAETLVAQGKTQEADRLITAVLQKEPRHVEALGAKGRLLVAEGHLADAIPFLEQAAITADPEPWIEVARVDLLLKDVAGARRAASEALKRSPGHPWALAVAGHALILEGRRTEGIQMLQAAVASGPRRPGAWLSLADAFEAAGDAQRAASCRREAKLLRQET